MKRASAWGISPQGWSLVSIGPAGEAFAAPGLSVGELFPNKVSFLTMWYAELEEVECVRCDDTYQRPVDSIARWMLCRRCASTVRRRAERMVQAFVVWRAAR